VSVSVCVRVRVRVRVRVCACACACACACVIVDDVWQLRLQPTTSTSDRCEYVANVLLTCG
jgi:hypothetical protein